MRHQDAPQAPSHTRNGFTNLSRVKRRTSSSALYCARNRLPPIQFISVHSQGSREVGWVFPLSSVARTEMRVLARSLSIPRVVPQDPGIWAGLFSQKAAAQPWPSLVPTSTSATLFSPAHAAAPASVLACAQHSPVRWPRDLGLNLHAGKRRPIRASPPCCAPARGECQRKLLPAKTQLSWHLASASSRQFPDRAFSA